MATQSQRSKTMPTARKPGGGKAKGSAMSEPIQKQTDLDDPIDEETLDDLFDDEDEDRNR